MWPNYNILYYNVFYGAYINKEKHSGFENSIWSSQLILNSFNLAVLGTSELKLFVIV